MWPEHSREGTEEESSNSISLRVRTGNENTNKDPIQRLGQVSFSSCPRSLGHSSCNISSGLAVGAFGLLPAWNLGSCPGQATAPSSQPGPLAPGVTPAITARVRAEPGRGLLSNVQSISVALLRDELCASTCNIDVYSTQVTNDEL